MPKCRAELRYRSGPTNRRPRVSTSTAEAGSREESFPAPSVGRGTRKGGRGAEIAYLIGLWLGVIAIAHQARATVNVEILKILPQTHSFLSILYYFVACEEIFELNLDLSV